MTTISQIIELSLNANIKVQKNTEEIKKAKVKVIEAGKVEKEADRRKGKGTEMTNT